MALASPSRTPLRPAAQGSSTYLGGGGTAREGLQDVGVELLVLGELRLQPGGPLMQLSYDSLLLEGEGGMMQDHGVYQQHLLDVVDIGERRVLLGLHQALVQQGGTRMVPATQQSNVHYQVAARPFVQQIRQSLYFLRIISLVFSFPEVVEVPFPEVFHTRADKPQLHGQTHVEEATHQLQAAVWLIVSEPHPHLILAHHRHASQTPGQHLNPRLP